MESFITHFHKKIFELEKRFSLLGIEEVAYLHAEKNRIKIRPSVDIEVLVTDIQKKM